MDKRLSKIIDENQQKFESWIEILNNHQSSFFGEKLCIADTEILSEKIANTIWEISNLAIKYGNFKDEFDNSKMHLNLYGPSIIIKSKKTGITFYLATDLNGIYLETYFLNEVNLKNMDDDFWKKLFELKKYKGFEYVENSYFDIDVQRKYPELFHTYKSTIFLMFRKYFLSQTENHNDIDLGSLKINWKSNENFETIISEICTSFKSMYKMNYKLWKITDLRNKKKN